MREDLGRMSGRLARLYCDACTRARQQVVFLRDGHYQLCGVCVAEYSAARTRGEPVSVGQFVRDKRFGDADRYRLASD